jgi:hypothetical protein
MRLDIDMWFETDQIRSILWDLELRLDLDERGSLTLYELGREEIPD